MGTEEKDIGKESLVQQLRKIRKDTEIEIEKVLYKLHKEHGITVNKIHMECTMLANGRTNEADPAYSVLVDLNYF